MDGQCDWERVRKIVLDRGQGGGQEPDHAPCGPQGGIWILF